MRLEGSQVDLQGLPRRGSNPGPEPAIEARRLVEDLGIRPPQTDGEETESQESAIEEDPTDQDYQAWDGTHRSTLEKLTPALDGRRMNNDLGKPAQCKDEEQQGIIASVAPTQSFQQPDGEGWPLQGVDDFLCPPYFRLEVGR